MTWSASLPLLGFMSRRESLCVGALGGVGLSLPQLLKAEERAPSRRTKSIILIVPWGGACQLDTFDLKPEAPAEVRSDFKPIATNVPGFQICEHLPRLAGLADVYSVIRSATHRIATHNSATHYALTGHPPAILNRELVPAQRSDWPTIGSVLAKFKPSDRAIPSYAMVPCSLIDQGIYSGGQNAGFLGPALDPFVVAGDPSKDSFTVSGLALEAGLTGERLEARRALLEHLDVEANGVAKSPATRNMVPHYQRAYDLIGSAISQQAFDLGREPLRMRERYGLNRHGQSVLLARRMVEAGVRLVLVSDTIENSNERWDTHNGPYADVRNHLLDTDLALSALLEDLRERGQLDSTLVVWMGEFGRTPKRNGAGGRDHWPHCYSLLMAGGGIQGGRVIGSSDKLAAFPSEHPVSPEELHATFYHCLGLPADTMVTDALGRPMLLCDGKPLRALL